MPEVRARPTLPVRTSRVWDHNHDLNCPRCGADNRNWVFVTENIRPLASRFVLTGTILSIILLSIIFYAYYDSFFPERTLAVVCLILAVSLPLLIVPGQWRALREFQLARRFLANLSPRDLAPSIQTAVLLYGVLVLIIPGIRYGLMPLLDYTVSTTWNIFGEGAATAAQAANDLSEAIDFLGDWLYRGTLASLVASIFAVLAVNEVTGRADGQLPQPIFASTANMVRVTLWEARRALEIKEYFDRIQWMLTRRNEHGGIDMEGLFRDPPEFLANGRLEETVRVQKYLISTDRWCRIISARIIDTKSQRPAGGGYVFPPFATEPSPQPVEIDRSKL